MSVTLLVKLFEPKRCEPQTVEHYVGVGPTLYCLIVSRPVCIPVEAGVF